MRLPHPVENTWLWLRQACCLRSSIHLSSNQVSSACNKFERKTDSITPISLNVFSALSDTFYDMSRLAMIPLETDSRQFWRVSQLSFLLLRLFILTFLSPLVVKMNKNKHSFCGHMWINLAYAVRRGWHWSASQQSALWFARQSAEGWISHPANCQTSFENKNLVRFTDK